MSEDTAAALCATFAMAMVLYMLATAAIDAYRAGMHRTYDEWLAAMEARVGTARASRFIVIHPVPERPAVQLVQSLEMPNTDACLAMLVAVARAPDDADARLLLADAVQEAGNDHLATWVRKNAELVKMRGRNWRTKRPGHAGTEPHRQWAAAYLALRTAGVAMDLWGHTPKYQTRQARLLGAPLQASDRLSLATEKPYAESHLFRYAVTDGHPTRLLVRACQLTRQNLASWVRYCPVTEVRFHGFRPVEIGWPAGSTYFIPGLHGSLPAPLGTGAEWTGIWEDIVNEANYLVGKANPSVSDPRWKTAEACRRDMGRAGVNVMRRAAGYGRLYHPPAKPAA